MFIHKIFVATCTQAVRMCKINVDGEKNTCLILEITLQHNNLLEQTPVTSSNRGSYSNSNRMNMTSEEEINKNNNSNSNCGNKEIKEEIVAVDKQKISESSNTEEWTNLNDNNIHHDLNDDDGDGGGGVNFKSKTNTNTIPTSSNHSVGSIGSITSGNIKKKVIKRRGWKKPKGKSQSKDVLDAYGYNLGN